jgi:dipeptidase
MRVTIAVEDNIVMVDREARKVDCSPLLADGVHAVQWYDEDVGELEFRTMIDKTKQIKTRKPNEIITDFSPYQPYVDLWQTLPIPINPAPPLTADQFRKADRK